MYTNRSVMASSQIIGLRNTFFLTKALKASGVSSSSISVLVSGRSGRPTEEGVSRSVSTTKSTPTKAIAAGAKKQ